MEWFENFTLIMRSGVTAILQKVEDPERMLNQLLIDMEEELDRAQAIVAGTIANEIQLAKEVKKAREEAEQSLERAAAALKKHDEPAAKSALEQKALAHERAQALEKEYEEQKQQTAELHRAVRDLEDKIRQARQKRALLLARLANAEAARRVNRALDRVQGRSAFAQFSRLEEQVERSEALSQAYDRLDDREPEAEELKRQFEEKERHANLQKELEELKRRVGES